MASKAPEIIFCYHGVYRESNRRRTAVLLCRLFVKGAEIVNGLIVHDYMPLCSYNRPCSLNACAPGCSKGHENMSHAVHAG